jgi:steroid delta-isomerase-like uncharacterized protein
MDPVQAVRDEIADLSRQDLEAVLGYYSEDVYFEDVSVPEPCRGKAAMRAFMAGFYRAFPDLRIEVCNIIASGNLVAAEYALLGTHGGEFMRHPPTGRTFRIPVVSIYEHDGSLFTRETVYYDSASLLTQLGIASVAF